MTNPAVKGRVSCEAVSVTPSSMRETIHPVRAPTAVSSCRKIALLFGTPD